MFNAVADRLERLRTRYAEPHRAYHTQAHIDAMLGGLGDLRTAFAEPGTAELAIWYHDAIYDPAAADNEARSAALLRSEMAGLADSAMVASAELLIQLTAGHVVPDGLPSSLANDAALFLDLDLAVLGAGPAEYDAYERGIEAEYVPVYGLDRFRAGRASFLQGMVDRPRMFLTDRFHAAHGETARSNIRRALCGLQP